MEFDPLIFYALIFFKYFLKTRQERHRSIIWKKRVVFIFYTLVCLMNFLNLLLGKKLVKLSVKNSSRFLKKFVISRTTFLD